MTTPNAISRPLVACLAGFALAACSTVGTPGSASQARSRTLVVQQEPPSFVDIEVDAKGRRVGDLYVFGARVTDSEGRKGSLIGTLLVVDIPDNKTGNLYETRIGDLTFTLGSDQLLVKGATVYPFKEKEMRVNQPQVRAIIGGTGQFVGQDGEVTTVRNANGTYTHTMRLTR
jgi:hypothetical protein